MICASWHTEACDFEHVKVENYPIRLNSLLNQHISNHIWLHLRCKMISKSNILIIIAQNYPEQLHDQIVLFQPLFLNLILKHFFQFFRPHWVVFKNSRTNLQIFYGNLNILSVSWDKKKLLSLKGQFGRPRDLRKMSTFSKSSVGAPVQFPNFQRLFRTQSLSSRPGSIAQSK